MNRKGLERVVAKKLHISRQDADNFMQVFLATMKKGLKEERELRIPHFGILWVKKIKPIVMKNIIPGRLYKIPEGRHSVKFKISDDFRREMYEKKD